MTSRCAFVVLIATCNRPSLLAKRALPSVAGQTRPPDWVVVADDSEPRFRARNQRAAEKLSAAGMRVTYVVNKRTKGASGAWNTGALEILNNLDGLSLDHVYLAILDDDDRWLPDYLMRAELSLSGAGEKGDFLAAAFERREKKERLLILPPSSLKGGDFLTGNPGVIGSTMIFRLSVFLRAGMFDEFLPACTDRDICFRVSLLPNITYRSLHGLSVIHYADSRLPRISNEHGGVKKKGLSRFIDKYRGWMDDVEYDAFCNRAKQLFGWTDSAEKSVASSAITVRHPKINGKITLIIGVIINPRQINDSLFADILSLVKDNRITSAKIVVMPSSGAHAGVLKSEVAKWRRRGLRMYHIGKIKSEWRSFFGTIDSRTMRPIAVNRTILQHAMSRLATGCINPVCWILDGDSRLHAMKLSRGRIINYRPDYVSEMIRLRDLKYDAAISEINGAPPLPRAFAVRTQMVDIMHIVGRSRLSPNDRHRPVINIASPEVSGGYYHDCVPHSHLEQPAGIFPPSHADNGIIRRLPELLNRILAGEAVTRPLLGGKKASYVHRGGNTLVFNTDMLRECPNGFLHGGLRDIRRQDEIWRIANERWFNRRIATGDFPVTQTRSDELPQSPDIERISNDIVGHAVATTLRHVCGERTDNGKALFDGAPLADFEFLEKMKEAIRTRLYMVRASFLRICGAAASMRGIIDDSGGKHGRAAVVALHKMEKLFSEDAFLLLEKKTENVVARVDIQKAIADFPRSCRDFAGLDKLWADWIKSESKQNAVALLEQTKLISKPVRFLGQGAEGAVFANDKYVFKVLHNWHSRTNVFNYGFLPGLAGKFHMDDTAFSVIRAFSDGGDLALMMPFEKTCRYTGGYGAGLVALLADFKRRGIAFWDMSPENLRRAGQHVRLGDYGGDIRPFTAHDFDLSVRKAWLCWRWAWRHDLRELLKMSLHNANLPELSGYPIMKNAVNRYARRYYIKDSAMAEVVRESPRSVLDYGCGKGKDAVELALRGIQTSAFDLALKATAVKRLRSAGVRIIKDINDEKGGYDVVLLRRVVCEIKSDKELRDCLKNIYRLLAPNGKVVVSACDVSGMNRSGTCSRNIMPPTADAERKFIYRKLVYATGNTRFHVHRPEHVLMREFARAGFRMVSRRVFGDIDIDRFEPCGGTLQWTFKRLSPRPPVSLIIRACAMDAADAELKIRHLVGQLNYPRGFSEVIVSIDGKAQGFLRQHTGGDLRALIRGMNRLHRDGWIDRIVISPDNNGEIRRLNKAWLGSDFPSTHALNGAPLTVVWAAFDRCRSAYALHIDIDMVVGRTNFQHDYLSVMLDAMRQHDAPTMSLNIPGASVALRNRRKTPYRLEVRAGLTDIARIKRLLPHVNFAKTNCAPPAGWHRAADIAITDKKLSSLRGGAQKLFVFHVPNTLKHRHEELDIALNSAERGLVPSSQKNVNEWNGIGEIPAAMVRKEKFVFVVCGRNVASGKIKRCLNSISAQRFENWGAVIMDDASNYSASVLLHEWADMYAAHATCFSRFRHTGGLANLVFAVRRLCTDPESVIITLDMDDALIGDDILTKLCSVYEGGADMTVGSMLRTDKFARYPVCFDNPRQNRGGNVWQHLRSFKKRLFDVVPDSCLRDDNGEYFNLAEDWAYMLPMVEAAKHPAWIKDVMYLYEPDVRRKAASKAKTEAAIARIIRRCSSGGKGK